MIKLYKYMSEKAALSFIKQPLLRISPSHQLNDPFEFLPSASSQMSLKKRFKHNIKEFMDLHGVLCLSEIPDNLLMWSHYADNHKGAVVEFFVDENDPFNLFYINYVAKTSDAKFDKVSYKKNRSYLGCSLTDDLQKIREHYTFTKSEDWDYEKEHRFIFPFTSISHELNTGEEMARFDSGLVNDRLPRKGLNADRLFFVQIDPSKIGRIILGLNANMDEYLDEMKKRQPSDFHREFWHFDGNLMNVESAELHPDRFELIFNRLEKNLYGCTNIASFSKTLSSQLKP